MTKEFFLTNPFSLRNVNTKTFILMLASQRPRDFISGGGIALGEVLRECNKKEFHHIYPRAFLKELKIEDNDIDCLANIAILPRASNNKISGQKPSEYRVLMPGNKTSFDAIERSAFLPDNWHDDDFAQFIQARAGLLVQKSKALMEL